MHRSFLTILRLGRAMLLSAALLAPGAQAGEWHRGASLTCTDCHTMHNSKFGLPMRYDSNPTAAGLLLRAANATALCLACHSGGASPAPNVRAPSDWDPPGGGFPPDLLDPEHMAHSIGPDPVLPPSGETEVVVTCITCHDPHGNGTYRNLRPNPSGDPTRTPATPLVQQGVTANGVNADVVYRRSNVRYLAAMSQWCITCHNLIGTESHFMSHPWDQRIWGSLWASFASWDDAWANRVPSQNASGAAAPDEEDQVFCLSCHKAHGSPNPGAVIYADGDQTSTCMQCHDQ